MNKISRFLGGTLTDEIAQTIKDANSDSDELNVDYVPLDRIDPDPNNPRTVYFTKDNIKNFDETTCNDKRMLEAWQTLLAMSASIKSSGVLQPIKIYRLKERFQIAFGGSRYLASMLAGKETIPAIILNEPPKNLRLIQWTENILRAGLTPWDRVRNINGILEEIKADNPQKALSTYLGDTINMSRSQVHAYLTIINGPEDVKELLKTGQLTSIDKAAYLSGIKDDEKRAEAINLILKGIDTKSVDNILEKDVKRKKADGRPRSSINLGKTTKINLIKKIMSSVSLNDRTLIDLEAIDWNDTNSVSKQWKIFLKTLELEIDE